VPVVFSLCYGVDRYRHKLHAETVDPADEHRSVKGVDSAWANIEDNKSGWGTYVEPDYSGLGAAEKARLKAWDRGCYDKRREYVLENYGEWYIQELDYGLGWRRRGNHFWWLPCGKEQIQAQAQPERFRIVDADGLVKFAGASKEALQLADAGEIGGACFILEVTVLEQSDEGTSQAWECLDKFATLKEAYSAANQMNLKPEQFRIIKQEPRKVKQDDVQG
jgi:hypothetical protein